MINDSSKMPFGTHRDKIMEKVPAGYLDWLHGEFHKKQREGIILNKNEKDVLEYIEKNRHIIDIELEEARQKINK